MHDVYSQAIFNQEGDVSSLNRSINIKGTLPVLLLDRQYHDSNRLIRLCFVCASVDCPFVPHSHPSVTQESPRASLSVLARW